MLTILKWSKTNSVISKQTFLPFFCLVILFLELPSHCNVSGVKISKQYPAVISNLNLFSILSTYIVNDGLSVIALCFLMTSPKQSWILDTEFHPLGN